MWSSPQACSDLGTALEPGGQDGRRRRARARAPPRREPCLRRCAQGEEAGETKAGGDDAAPAAGRMMGRAHRMTGGRAAGPKLLQGWATWRESKPARSISEASGPEGFQRCPLLFAAALRTSVPGRPNIRCSTPGHRWSAMRQGCRRPSSAWQRRPRLDRPRRAALLRRHEPLHSAEIWCTVGGNSYQQGVFDLLEGRPAHAWTKGGGGVVFCCGAPCGVISFDASRHAVSCAFRGGSATMIPER